MRRRIGKTQLDWLLDGLTRSDATWKIVSSDVPVSVPTGSQADLYGHDSFADGNDPWERTGYAARTLDKAVEIVEAADVFPMMTDDELQDLAEDIKKNGLHEPLVVADIGSSPAASPTNG